MDQKPEPIVLDMYTEVSRIKHVFRHFEGIPLPLPIPLTISGIVTGFSWIIIALYLFPGSNPLLHYFGIPIVLASMVSYFEPETIHPFQWVYARLRKWFKPIRRVGNRPVPMIGYKKTYTQPTIVHRSRRK